MDQPKRKPPNAGKGRPKGSKNRVTLNLRDEILRSFQTLGGHDYLVKLGQEDKAIYGAILRSLNPREIAVPVVLEVNLVGRRATDEAHG